jgi:hypothetical protein
MKSQYEAELADAGHQVAALPEDVPLFRERSRRGPHFRWPWQRRTDEGVPKAALRDRPEIAAAVTA